MSDTTSELEKIRERADRIAAFEMTQAERDRASLLDVLDSALNLMRDLTDPDDCTFDHHGCCQAHGYLDLAPGDKCPQREAKEMIAELQGDKA